MSSTATILVESGNRMFDATRTTRVLGALLVSMTVGALLLMLMESDPPRPSQSDRAAITSSGCNVQSIHYGSQSLETLFLSLTSRALRD